MKYIELSKDKKAIVDDEDYPYLSRFKWRIGGREGNEAVRTTIRTTRGDSYSLPMSHLLMARKMNYNILHKNKDFLDYRKENLIYAFNSHRAQMSRKPLFKGGTAATSIYKGVCRCSKINTPNIWQAKIVKDRKVYWLGHFRTEKQAAIAYNKKALDLYGEFAYQNKV